MADTKQPVSFDEIIQADRARRKNEQLANEIFGRNKKNKDAVDRNHRSSSRTPSLASRMGVQKRTSSTSVPTRPNPPSRPSSTSAQRERSSRLASALDSPSHNQANISKSRGITIKGAAGPFTVTASNFAPGTTAADIESAVANDSTDSEGQSGLVACRLISSVRDPQVTAELVFSERTIADRVIAIYNNQRADGRILKLSLTPSTSKSTNPALQPQTQPAAADEDGDDDVPMAEDPLPSTSHYSSSRENEAANRTRSNEHRNARADPEIQDGRYGFSSTSSRPNDPPTSPAAAHENGSRRDDDVRERSRSHSRDHDRREERRDDRERDRRYDDRSYDRRDDRRDDRREDRRYDNRPPYDAPRGGRSSHYGNGVGGPRGGYGFGAPGRGGGRMYSDGTGNMAPRGGSSMRGGYRGRW